ncbi:MAG TPA: glycosyltransferase family 4 protein [Chroococcidiopsis sp.]
MKILIYSPLFYPSVGGLETVVAILAQEFVAQGHTVKLVCHTPAAEDSGFPFVVIRQPSAPVLLQLLRWCDLYFQPNISLKGLWPLLICPRPWVVSHNNWYCRVDGRLAWQDRLKQRLLTFATNISVSQAVAAHIAQPSTVIPNPYRDGVFYPRQGVVRDRPLIFVGRLVSDKGVDLLLAALAQLRSQGLTPMLTVVGGGPEEAALKAQAQQLGISDQVDFVGVKVGEELAQLLSAHQILVVPSRWQEPFGIVALEGIACGCVVVGSEGGGLPEAIGPCGVTFANGDVVALTQALANLLTCPDRVAHYQNNAVSHCDRHRAAAVAVAYLRIFEGAIW